MSAGRPGNIGQVSRRLRPMAEQLLAENGDNVLDVLLQLLKVPASPVPTPGNVDAAPMWPVTQSLLAGCMLLANGSVSQSQPFNSLSVDALLTQCHLQGIQDGTLPADVETAVSDAAGSSSARALSGSTGGTSLDRLVLNQLVTVLQATSALSGAGRQSTADSGPGTLQVWHASDLDMQQLSLQAGNAYLGHV